MPKTVARANGRKSVVRAAVEHVFAHQKGPMALVVRTIGLARATVKIGLANLAYNRAWTTCSQVMPAMNRSLITPVVVKNRMRAVVSAMNARRRGSGCGGTGMSDTCWGFDDGRYWTFHAGRDSGRLVPEPVTRARGRPPPAVVPRRRFG